MPQQLIQPRQGCCCCCCCRWYACSRAWRLLQLLLLLLLLLLCGVAGGLEACTHPVPVKGEQLLLHSTKDGLKGSRTGWQVRR
jgi:hypothetical protein